MEHTLHINVLEMEAVRLAITQLAPVPLSVILVASNNACLVAYINHEGGGGRGLSSSGPRFSGYFRRPRPKVTIGARHIPGRLNVIDDLWSRADQILSAEYSLLQDIVRDVFLQWGHPNLDLFATHYNHKCLVFVSPMPYPLALDT